MSIHGLRSFAHRSASPFQAKGAHFDGSNDVLVGTGLATVSAQRLLISAALRVTGGAGSIRYFANITGTRLYGYAHSSNTYRVGIRNAASTTLAEWRFTTNLTADTDWKHLLVYFDGITPANTFGMLNGVAEGSDTTGTAGTFNTDQTSWAVGGTTSSSFLWEGDISELWVGDPGRTVVPADLSRFFRAGRPTPLGGQGKAPFGARPMFYFNGGPSDFGKNAGSAGDMPITGALTSAQQLLGFS